MPRDTGIAIRTYVAADRDAVNAVALAAFAQYAGDYDDWPAFSAGIGRTADLADHADLLVAELDGACVGAIAHVGPGRPRSPIYPPEWSVVRMLVVDPAWRGRGAGTQLVAACLAHAHAARAPAVGLHTSPVMATALRLYEAIGFRRDRDLDPIAGVPYGRYVLDGGSVPAALALLRNGLRSLSSSM